MSIEDRERVALPVTAYEDMIHRIASFEEFMVAGRVYRAELIIPQLVTNMAQLAEESATAAVMIAYWGREAARARRYKSQMEATYRQWKARQMIDLKKSKEDEGAKTPSDAMVANLYRIDPAYAEWQRRINDAQEAAENAEMLYEAFKVKARMIEASQKILHDEAGGAYRVVPANPIAIPRQPKLES